MINFIPYRFIFSGCVLLGAGLLASQTHASFDSACQPDWSVELHSYNRCSNLPILSPANDNQINMQLLLADKLLAKIEAPKPQAMQWFDSYGSVPFEASEFKYSLSNLTPSGRAKTSESKEQSDRYIAEERCRTNASGTQIFLQQIAKDSGLNTAEKKLLAEKRLSIDPSCDKALAFIKVANEWSPLVRQYMAYLNGSIAFYNGDYATAQRIYKALNSVKSPWLAETAAYMQVRTAVNEAYTSGLDEYGFQYLDNIDKNAIAAAFNAVTYYFKNYPQGQYVASTRGVLRRIYWMGGQQRKLIDEFNWQFNNASSPQFNLEMPLVAEEINQRIFESRLFEVANFKDPFFVATYDLMHMRVSSSKKYTPLSWQTLQAQKNIFKTEPELYRYLQAMHLLVQQNKPQQALEYLPKGNPPARLNYLQLSQFILKSHILQSTNSDEAQSLLEVLLASAKQAYQRPMVELMLALNLQHAQDYAAFFQANGLITSPALRLVIIKRAASADLLNSIIKSSSTSASEKKFASFVLLHKTLNHQAYDQFIEALKFLPKDSANFKSYDSANEAYSNQPEFNLFNWKGHKISEQLTCPSIVNIAKTLSTEPEDQMAQLCFGEFVRLTNFRNSEYIIENEATIDNLKASASSTVTSFNHTLANHASPFSKPTFSRGEVYKNIIRNSNNADLKAYALYRAINCYAPGGLNDCAGIEVDKSVRKEWFDQLKQNYPNTEWAKKLPYYW